MLHIDLLVKLIKKKKFKSKINFKKNSKIKLILKKFGKLLNNVRKKCFRKIFHSEKRTSENWPFGKTYSEKISVNNLHDMFPNTFFRMDNFPKTFSLEDIFSNGQFSKWTIFRKRHMRPHHQRWLKVFAPRDVATVLLPFEILRVQF